MPIAVAGLRTLKRLVGEILRGRGYRSMLEACREERVDYTVLQRAIRQGITDRTTAKTVESLRRMGVLVAIREAHCATL